VFKKNYLKFETDIDFNFIANLLAAHDLKSLISSRWIGDYIADSVFQIKNVHNTKEFNQIFKDLNNRHNKKNLSSALDVFYSYVPGAHSNTHADLYDVFIIGLKGRTLYKTLDKEYLVGPADLLFLKKGTIHTAIALEPRIILSYATYN
tara:strand:- start:76 stop:522 length:447 start_codon:yes stop_codon:yes gene_type:complete